MRTLLFSLLAFSFIEWMSFGLYAETKDASAEVRTFITEFRSLYGGGDAKKIQAYLGKNLQGSDLAKKLSEKKVPKVKFVKLISLQKGKNDLRVRWYSDSTPNEMRMHAPTFVLKRGGKHKFLIEKIEEPAKH